MRRQTSVIGRARDALIRLRGWFKSKVAVVVSRTGEDDVATPVGGRPRVNSQQMRARQVLHGGDVLQISGLTVEFTSGGRPGRHREKQAFDDPPGSPGRPPDEVLPTVAIS